MLYIANTFMIPGFDSSRHISFLVIRLEIELRFDSELHRKFSLVPSNIYKLCRITSVTDFPCFFSLVFFSM